MPVTHLAIHACVLVAALSIAAPARAGDGVLEINQTCATTTGCFPGDSAGFPVTITDPGSYRLTSNLTLSAANQTAIRFSTTTDPIVTIDLGGFAITGVVTCTGEPAACTGTDGGEGIVGGGFSTIRNGTVRGMGAAGIRTGVGSLIENVLAEQNGTTGIQISTGGGRRSIVRGCRVLRNGEDGLGVSYQDGNGNPAGQVITGNLVAGNGGYGIRGQGSTVVGNVVANNLLAGIFLNGNGGYADNLVFGNNGGNVQDQILNSGDEIGDNLCGNDTNCP
jgi:hypothetical protein